MSKLVRRATSWLAVALACSCPTVALAQTGSPATAAAAPKKGFSEQKTENGSSVAFDDDLGIGTAYDPFADIVKGPPRVARVNLLRPRYNFIPEMLKSVENL